LKLGKREKSNAEEAASAEPEQRRENQERGSYQVGHGFWKKRWTEEDGEGREYL
jgi:hypothetical protein